MRETLVSVWSHTSNGFASEFLEGWSRGAGATGIQMLPPVVRRLASQGERRKKSCEVSLSSVPVEAISNPIKATKHQAYGLPDHELKVRISATHETPNASVRLTGSRAFMVGARKNRMNLVI
jgi:Transposase